eukprot:9467919-Pyramimonas_sp.AAC.1
MSTIGNQQRVTGPRLRSGGCAVAVAAPSPLRRRPPSGPSLRSGGYVVAAAAPSPPCRRFVAA